MQRNGKGILKILKILQQNFANLDKAFFDKLHDKFWGYVLDFTLCQKSTQLCQKSQQQ